MNLTKVHTYPKDESSTFEKPISGHLNQRLIKPKEPVVVVVSKTFKNNIGKKLPTSGNSNRLAQATFAREVQYKSKFNTKLSIGQPQASSSFETSIKASDF